MTMEQAICVIQAARPMNGPNSKMINDALDFAIAALREQEERRWIPVTERMPECGKRVLATDGGFVGEFYINKRGQWKRYNVNDYSLLMALDILFWMPLPEPPKEVPENETL